MTENYLDNIEELMSLLEDAIRKMESIEDYRFEDTLPEELVDETLSLTENLVELQAAYIDRRDEIEETELS